MIGAKKGHQRRLSDPSSAIHEFMRMGILDKPSNTRAIIDRPVGTSLFGGSESDGLDSFGDAHCEIYAGDLLDEFEEAKYNPLWTMKGIESYQRECLLKNFCKGFLFQYDQMKPNLYHLVRDDNYYYKNNFLRF